ncbi:alpha-ketoacid dehydrogenase subunit beta [Xenorhabdus miraniensis]|uniref:2-oxoisovalerate dehydrogenase subunit beta n=1 Tax=Xenorhabdus miraniensis TaxID=351674 RepID=A0A2D0JJA2_9GAMM|nr:alpha-ketoacid dehydrogenase subunit beta [Xenorhabdus miraniensis]PHM45227.1 pyruvate dehydrogenase e1-beta chain [Xenorhabdus miraniensis]
MSDNRMATSLMTFAEALNSALDYSMRTNPNVVLLGEDIGKPSGGIYKVTQNLEERYGAQRVRTTPISEQGIIGLGTGLALCGKRPVVEIMLMDYLTVASDQLVNHAAKLRYTTDGVTRVPLTVRMHVGGGTMGGAQHSQSLESWLTHIPGLNIVMPSTPEDARGLLLSCINNDDPCVMLECIELLWSRERQPVPTGNQQIPLGKARVRRTGDDITLVAYGRSVTWCLHAAERAAQRFGIRCEVIDLRSLTPLDLPLVLYSARKTRRVLVAHAANQFCGYGAEIACLITEVLHSSLLHPVVRVGSLRSPVPYSTTLEQLHTPDAELIFGKIMNIFNLRESD